MTGSAQDWQERLFSALTSMFARPTAHGTPVEVGKAKALAWIFGRETLVELSLDQLPKT
ncbi:hypothetical protein ABH926_003864 [Catenulispora sp. GP43]|uniref:hypothetical protein n=1 Tax=Catenulispora sp. GP43 TaxID=3156263 RepID=UPI00351798D9